MRVVSHPLSAMKRSKEKTRINLGNFALPNSLDDVVSIRPHRSVPSSTISLLKKSREACRRVRQIRKTLSSAFGMSSSRAARLSFSGGLYESNMASPFKNDEMRDGGGHGSL